MISKTVKTVKKGCVGLTALENREILETSENLEILKKLDFRKYQENFEILGKFWNFIRFLWNFLKFIKA